ncbi:hypothetical protein [Fervidobacterium sp. 2310opik-2]|uniref:hypothetical protein n=1 Tax=Fervidobacterium sp. 2310opik-2 TaxID=1755815 RepID=UPI0013E093D8|nr:hypothetical protein [Fervidobacterium sp. 2310opik-2]KAF2961851.1 hypothetical protein AS161_07065 [Fervidobacterium sp. 2310opik-2]
MRNYSNFYKTLIVIFLLFISSLPIKMFSQEKNEGISVYGFIEKMAGQRDFSISVKLTFETLDGEKRKVFTTAFDMRVDNLENFNFKMKQPEILDGIVINYNVISKKIEYVYKNIKTSEIAKAETTQIGEIVQNITDFLSSPLFDAKEYKDYVEFRPKNFQVLSRFGVQPIIVRMYVKNDLPERIEITNDKTDEKVTLKFEKFIIGK